MSAYWLAKSEPDSFSWDDLAAKGSTQWDGVRNYLARNHLKAMQVGDSVLFYHSVVGRQVVGIMKVAREAFPDPTAPEGDDRWVAVEMVPYMKFAHPVSLETIKATPALQNMPFLKQSRLSVSPVTQEAFETIVALGSVKKH